MIHHLSVSANDPKGAAEFFADLMGGVVVDFPPNPGSFMVFKADGRGTGLEIYPPAASWSPTANLARCSYASRRASTAARRPTSP
jgi:catechol 2,3-dioxygenase-like lactoylglutathione lyase family enzyme